MAENTTPRLEEIKKQVDSFLENYPQEKELQLLISSSEKTYLEGYILKHQKGGSAFRFRHGVLKPGRLEHDYRLYKLQR